MFTFIKMLMFLVCERRTDSEAAKEEKLRAVLSSCEIAFVSVMNGERRESFLSYRRAVLTSIPRENSTAL